MSFDVVIGRTIVLWSVMLNLLGGFAFTDEPNFAQTLIYYTRDCYSLIFLGHFRTIKNFVGLGAKFNVHWLDKALV